MCCFNNVGINVGLESGEVPSGDRMRRQSSVSAIASQMRKKARAGHTAAVFWTKKNDEVQKPLFSGIFFSMYFAIQKKSFRATQRISKFWTEEEKGTGRQPGDGDSRTSFTNH